jgi:hypothetical protein
MKIKLVLKDAAAQTVWANAERTAKRVGQWPAWKREGIATTTTSVTASTAETPAPSESAPAVDKK